MRPRGSTRAVRGRSDGRGDVWVRWGVGRLSLACGRVANGWATARGRARPIGETARSRARNRDGTMYAAHSTSRFVIVIVAHSCHTGQPVDHPANGWATLGSQRLVKPSRSFRPPSGTRLASLGVVSSGDPVPRTRHDAFVRHVFGRPQAAAIEFRHVLPPEIVAELDLDTLTTSSSAYRRPSRTPLDSDLVSPSCCAVPRAPSRAPST